MFRGALTARGCAESGRQQARSDQFYAHLYIGLYSEALGRKNVALEHIKEAASDRYAAAGGYMHMVARVHAKVLDSKF